MLRFEICCKFKLSTCSLSSRIFYTGLHVGRYPPQTVYVLGPAPTLSPSFLLTQATFEPNLSPINTPTFSNLVILHTYPPMKVEQSVPKR